MEAVPLIKACVSILVVVLAAFVFWRYVWFFRNPDRTAPDGENIVCPADGTVVYVKRVEPGESVISIKQGVQARIQDILKEDVDSPKYLVGIFMSPFNVHYNRAPLAGTVESIKHHPAVGGNVHMGPMHMRTILKQEPYYENSLHIVQNERTITRIRGSFKGRELSTYVVQIGGKSVHGIESYFREGEIVGKGAIFGMIRIGSQVDLVIPRCEGMSIKVRPGDSVRAGETVVVA